MKKNLVLAVAVVTIGFLTSCGGGDKRKKFDDVVAYNDYIVDVVNDVDQTYVKTLDVLKGKEYCVAQCDSLTNVCTRSLTKLNIQPYKGDSSFVESSKEFVNYMSGIAKKDLPAYIDLLFAEEYTTEMETKIDNMAKELDGNYDKYFAKIEAAQSSLSTKFNYKIETK